MTASMMVSLMTWMPWRHRSLYEHLDDGAFDDLHAVEAQEPEAHVTQEPLSVVRDHGFGVQREHELHKVSTDRPEALQDHKERHPEARA